MSELATALQQGNARFEAIQAEIAQTEALVSSLREVVRQADEEAEKGAARLAERAGVLVELATSRSGQIGAAGVAAAGKVHELAARADTLGQEAEAAHKEVLALPQGLTPKIDHAESEIEGYIEKSLEATQALQDIAEQSREQLDQAVAATAREVGDAAVPKLTEQEAQIEAETAKLREYLETEFVPAVQREVTSLASHSQDVVRRANTAIDESERRTRQEAEDAVESYEEKQEKVVGDLQERAEDMEQALGDLASLARNLSGDFDEAKDSLKSAFESTQTGFKTAVGTLERIRDTLEEIF